MCAYQGVRNVSFLENFAQLLNECNFDIKMLENDMIRSTVKKTGIDFNFSKNGSYYGTFA